MDEQQSQNVHGLAAVRQEFSGPIPHPMLLQQYDQVIPGAAERILKMAENQSAHRMDLEKIVIRSDVTKSERGQVFGLGVAILGIIASIILGLAGHEIAAGIIGGSDLVSLASVFVFGRRRKELERARIRDAEKK